MSERAPRSPLLAAAAALLVACAAACEKPQLEPLPRRAPPESAADASSAEPAATTRDPEAVVTADAPASDDPDVIDPRRRVKPVWRGGKAPPPSEEPPDPEERWLQCEQYDIDFDGKNLRTLRIGKPTWPEVLLLHGARFDSRTWLELGTLELLAKNGYRAVAIDLPGYGRSEKGPVALEQFLWIALPFLDLKRPVVLFPSMSGTFAFPFLIDHPTAVAGVVPIAPAGVPDFGARLTGFAAPALIVWGEADNVFPLSQAETLKKLWPNSSKLLLPKAGHACYQDAPDEFHAGLLAFLKTIDWKSLRR